MRHAKGREAGVKKQPAVADPRLERPSKNRVYSLPVIPSWMTAIYYIPYTLSKDGFGKYRVERIPGVQQFNLIDIDLPRQASILEPLKFSYLAKQLFGVSGFDHPRCMSGTRTRRRQV